MRNGLIIWESCSQRRYWFSGYMVGPRILHFWHLPKWCHCCWSMGHILCGSVVVTLKPSLGVHSGHLQGPQAARWCHWSCGGPVVQDWRMDVLVDTRTWFSGVDGIGRYSWPGDMEMQAASNYSIESVSGGISVFLYDGDLRLVWWGEGWWKGKRGPGAERYMSPGSKCGVYVLIACDLRKQCQSLRNGNKCLVLKHGI